MSAPDVQAEPPDGGAGRYQATMPAPLEGAKEVRWERYVAEKLVIRVETAKNLADYGKALASRYATVGPPQSARDLEAYAGRTLATEVLRRSSWQANGVSLQCAADAISHGPELLLATIHPTSFAGAPNFDIYATTGLYGLNATAPVGFRRSYGKEDGQVDEAIAQLLNSTIKVATSCGCTAPLVSDDLGLADHLIGRLASDAHAFAAAIGPDWCHGDIRPYDEPKVLLGNSPFELFVAQGEDVHKRARPEGRPVELIAMQYRGRPNGLFYVLVSGEHRPFFLVRPPPSKTIGIHQQMTAAAELAVRAAALHDVRPLDALGLDRFVVSEDADLRWLRHTTMVQAVITFSLIDLSGDGGTAS